MFPRSWQFILFLKVGNDKEWLLTGSVTQLVLAIISKDTRTPLERWVFDIFLIDPAPEGEARYDCYLSAIAGSALILMNSRQAKPESEIQSEIRAILKQIISMVTYLPVIHEPTVFNILAYTSESADVPAGEWVDTDPLAIEASKSQQVKMRSFSTDVHRIEAMVAYRYDE
jgi:mitotic spindle assembly checkpoint protein MAD2